MFELFIFLFTDFDARVGVKYLLKEKFVDYQSCEEYVDEHEVNFNYTINKKDYRVGFTYCKPIEKGKINEPT